MNAKNKMGTVYQKGTPMNRVSLGAPSRSREDDRRPIESWMISIAGNLSHFSIQLSLTTIPLHDHGNPLSVKGIDFDSDMYLARDIC
jgi:hypothetical protein